MLNKLQMRAVETLCYVLGAGAFGVFIRWLQSTAGTTDEGLYNNTIWNYLVPIVIIAGFFLFGAMTNSIRKDRYYLNEDLSAALANSGKVFSVVRVIIGASMAVGGLLLIMSCETDKEADFLRLIAVFAILSGAGFIWLMKSFNAPEKKGGLMCLAATLPIIMYSLWLVCTYKMNDKNGVIWQYGVEIIAICAAMMAFFRCAGFSFASPDLFTSLKSSMFGIFMLVISLADGRYAGQQLIIISSVCMLLYYDWVLITNLARREAPPSYQPNDGGFEQLN